MQRVSGLASRPAGGSGAVSSRPGVAPALFLAYAVQDRRRAEAVRGELLRAGFELWDASQLVAGTDWRVSILDRLRDAAAIVVLTSGAAKSSEWVQREVGYALTSAKPIIPLALDGTILPELSDLQHARLGADGSVPDAVIAYLRKIVKGVKHTGSDAAREIIQAFGNRSISAVVDEVQSRVVLLLGNFAGAGIDRLVALQAALERCGFHPVIFDFERPRSADYGETIRLLAGLSGFVVAEMTDPRSVAMELQLIAPQLSVPIVPLLAKGQQPLALFGDFGKYDWVLPTRVYDDLPSLVSRLDELVISPAQQKLAELRERKTRR
jgi:hypothetical protein